MKGGPQSIRAARLSGDHEFLMFLASESGTNPVNSEFAENWIKETVGIKSRVELDHDEAALNRFNKLVMSPFNRWRG